MRTVPVRITVEQHKELQRIANLIGGKEDTVSKFVQRAVENWMAMESQTYIDEAMEILDEKLAKMKAANGKRQPDKAA